jgi:hypothetical protein
MIINRTHLVCLISMEKSLFVYLFFYKKYDGISFLFRARVEFLSELCRSFALGVVRETLSSTILLFSFVSIKHPIFIFFLGCVTINSLIGYVGSYRFLFFPCLF